MSLILSNNELKEKYLPKSLKQGDVVKIIIQQDNGEYKYEFDAILVERLDSWAQPEPFPFIEYSETKVVNAIKEKWKIVVKSDSPFENGQKRIRWIPRFYSTGIVRIKEIEEEEFFEDGEDDNIFI